MLTHRLSLTKLEKLSGNNRCFAVDVSRWVNSDKDVSYHEDKNLFQLTHFSSA